MAARKSSSPNAKNRGKAMKSVLQDNIGGGPLPPRLQERNENGGYVVHEQEIKDAFHILNADGREALTREDLTMFLDKFFPGMLTMKDVRLLIGPSGLKMEKLQDILMGNDLTDFDPCQEAFKILDPEGTGVVDKEVLKGLLQNMPYVGEVSRDDMDFLMKYMDADEDGNVGLEDFAAIGKYAVQNPEDPLMDDTDFKNMAGGSILQKM
eukprot:CAMPEP_0196588548 /NCGR_PEP_ID=MMETSP1081-20130531/60832_1 /TAXON_ID=36882 /ORGANISM="Pyramimonas amylifera, Strain CCMP720" /LENGTH=208 /DNA_ID=CAMNT_0041911065 /DNA_START=88 /DNA_END=714 /DNA_ORIENTATION=-